MLQAPILPRVEGETVIVDELLSGDRGYAKGPERALLSAVLFDGVQAYMSHAFAGSSRKRSKYREAYHWVHSNNDEYVFSFDNCCDALGVNPEALRYGLMNACTSLAGHWKRSRRKF
ncbi:MAG: hypothetical protein QY326_07755 [Bdellovibrionota bacterium]|nr:MAG: hypothetical protein QY326_07755 [Bdellovibrionota bacterium]